MKIKKIKKQGTKYKIILENNEIITTYDEIILNNNILYKKEIDTKLLNIILEENKYFEAYNKVLKYINIKLRSKYNIRNYIDKLDISSSLKNDIFNKIIDNKLVDDNIYVKAYIHDRLTLSSDGPNKIKNELLKEKIDLNIILSELENIDSEIVKNKLEKIVIKKINSNTKYTYGALKTKLLGYFINLGYDKSDILYFLEKNKNNNKVSTKDLLNKEYNKLYTKYKNKYEEYQLKQIIRQKLYQKGFNSDEINNVI